MLTLLLAVVVPLVLPLLVNGAADWRTAAERSGFKSTSNYDDTVSFCRRLDEASPWIRYLTFGQSHDGRDSRCSCSHATEPSRPKPRTRPASRSCSSRTAFTRVRSTGKRHCFALAREIAITKTLEGLLDSAILLVIPIYNVDGHEMSSPYNRFNQKGPEEMGWRANAQNLNLNRDYLKADAPETRALLALWDWRPDLFVDTHVTDGADFQYDVLYTMESTGYVAPEIARYVEEVFQPHVRPAMEREGHVVGPTSCFGPRKSPRKGSRVSSSRRVFRTAGRHSGTGRRSSSRPICSSPSRFGSRRPTICSSRRYAKLTAIRCAEVRRAGRRRSGGCHRSCLRTRVAPSTPPHDFGDVDGTSAIEESSSRPSGVTSAARHASSTARPRSTSTSRYMTTSSPLRLSPHRSATWSLPPGPPRSSACARTGSGWRSWRSPSRRSSRRTG